MDISLPSDVLKTLPGPDRNGLVRVLVALKLKQDGKASIVEINDVPCGCSKAEKSDLDEATESLPSPQDIASQVLGNG